MEKSELRRDSRVVFLCGGRIDLAHGPLPSVRDALLRHLPNEDILGEARIIRAERATEALPGSNFTNLLDLEEYIAALADGVILIVESAGSICELGAFVKTEEIRDKLIVIISNDHDNKPSFIKLGALRYFDECYKGDAEIHPYQWDVTAGVITIQQFVLDGIVDSILGSIKKVRPRGRLRVDSLGDRMLLTLSLCHLMRGARIPEIKECYDELALGEYDGEIVKQLSALEICGLVLPVKHGKKYKYFVPVTDKMPLKIAFNAKAVDQDRDTLRWITEISDLIAKHEPTRMKLFQEHHHAP